MDTNPLEGYITIFAAAEQIGCDEAHVLRLFANGTLFGRKDRDAKFPMVDTVSVKAHLGTLTIET